MFRFRYLWALCGLCAGADCVVQSLEAYRRDSTAVGCLMMFIGAGALTAVAVSLLVLWFGINEE